MRKSICHKRNFCRMFVCIIMLSLLALAGCGNKNMQKDNSLQENQDTENQASQGTEGQGNQGTGNQASQEVQGGQSTENENSQGTEGQGNQGTGNQASQEAQGNQSQQASGSQQQGQAGLANQPKIGLEEAKEAAVKHAGLSGDEVTFTKEELDYDDGRAEYDIEFVTGTTKYEYEISAEDGAILGSSQEPVEQLSGNVQGTISAEEAKEAVLNHAGFTADQVNFTKVELELDDGVAEYEIEFYANGREYSSKVNASTGAIMEYEMD